jgi:hypothetical protein
MFSKADVLNTTYLEELVGNFKDFNRFPAKMTPGSKFSNYFQGLLKDMEFNFKVQKFPAPDVTLYNSKQESLSVYKVKPAMLDLYIFLGVLGYLAVLWLVIKFLGKKFIKSKKN